MESTHALLGVSSHQPFIIMPHPHISASCRHTHVLLLRPRTVKQLNCAKGCHGSLPRARLFARVPRNSCRVQTQVAEASHARGQQQSLIYIYIVRYTPRKYINTFTQASSHVFCDCPFPANFKNNKNNPPFTKSSSYALGLARQ